MKHVIGTAVLIISMCACAPKQDANNGGSERFKINGKVSGMHDSVWLFLQTSGGRLLDSAQVFKGEFSMTGKIADSVATAQVILRTKDFTDYKFFWAEHSDIKLKAEKGNFRLAVISGSKTQSEADAYDAIVQPLDEKFDSLVNIARKANFEQGVANKMRALEAEVMEQRKLLTIAFVKDHPNSIVSVSLLDTYSTTWGKKSTVELYNLLSNELKNSSYGKSIGRYIALNQDIQVGDKFADFSQMNADGQKAKLSDVRGKVTLLEFWAAWCGPCRQANPELVATYKKFKDKGFEIFGVSLDQSKDNWIQAIKADGLPWTNVSELNGDKNAAVLIYGISAIPDNFLIDETGTIIERNIRGEDLNKKLSDLLN